MDTNSLERLLKGLNKVATVNTVDIVIDELNLNILDVAKNLETRIFKVFNNCKYEEYTSQIAEYEDLKYTISVKLEHTDCYTLESYYSYSIVLNLTQEIFTKSLPVKGLSKISKDIIKLIVKDIINRRW